MESAFRRQHETIAHFIDRVNEETSIEVLEKIKTESKVTAIKILIHVFATFFRSFIVNKEYKKGIAGFINARLEAISTLIQYAKVWEYQMRSKDGTGFMPPSSIEEVYKLKQRYTTL